MHYLKLRRTRIILLSFGLFSLLVTAFPAVDIRISRLFFHGSSFLRDQWWQRLLQDGLGYFICLSLAAVFAIYVGNRLTKRKVCSVDGRKVVFLLLVLIMGAGLIVNGALKNNFGRARPRDIAEFGGPDQFTPAFQVSRECASNCSFSSGDAAGAFFSLALAMALTRRRRFFLAGMGLGALVSLSRISAGAHFFSDTVVSFFVMLIVADVLYYYLVLTNAERVEAGVAGSAFRPAYVATREARAIVPST